MKYIKPRGTQDISGISADIFDNIVNTFSKLVTLYGYDKIIVPTFENAELYKRQLPTADIVIKELYEFKDNGGRSLALRPEFTAGVARFLLENKLYTPENIPLRVYYYGSAFRYERPQTNRYREFNQFGIECFGVDSVENDLEIILIANEGIKKLGIKNCKLKINNLGNTESRIKWINSLKKYFNGYKDELSEISKSRIATNPLRIFDDKVDGEKKFVKNAPKIDEFLSISEKKRFAELVDLLKKININFEMDKTLVRGLDYYTNLVFEFIDTDVNNQQNTLLAGGRYNDLVNDIGCINLPAIGFSMGIERIVQKILEKEDIKNRIENVNKIDLYVFANANVDKNINKFLNLTDEFRKLNFKVINGYIDSGNKKFKQHINIAKHKKVRYALEIISNNFDEFLLHDLVNNSKNKLFFKEVIKALKI